jgi:hypothetical protein
MRTETEILKALDLIRWGIRVNDARGKLDQSRLLATFGTALEWAMKTGRGNEMVEKSFSLLRQARALDNPNSPELN